MTNNNDSGFSVLDMAQEYASNNEIDVAEIFKKNPVSGNIKAEANLATESDVQNNVFDVTSRDVAPAPAVDTSRKAKWTPDAKLTADLPDLNAAPIVYEKKDLIVNESGELKNIADDNALEASRASMDDLTRKYANIEDAKKALGIVKLKIPEGPYHARIIAAAGDTDYRKAQSGITEVLKEIIEVYPFWVLEWDPGKDPNSIVFDKDNARKYHDEAGNKPDNVSPISISNNQTNTLITDLPENVSVGLVPGQESPVDPENNIVTIFPDSDDAKIIIDKSSLPKISWTEKELQKIRKSRSIELNIVETSNLEYTNITDIADNAVDVVLSQYQRKINDVISALPASKYRATFTGLNYTEVLDLNNSQELNNLDGERKKWSIAFDHMRNQSIGPWEEYSYYIDSTGKKIKFPYGSPTPVAAQTQQVHHVSKFDDFLMKTSFMDLEFILWKILCATAMDKEIISVDCHSKSNGVECKNSYDWIYSPSDLLSMDKINVAVLDEIKMTMEAATVDGIAVNYESSMLCINNTVKLPTSKFGVVFGHVSAYDYLAEIYSEIKSLEDQEGDPELLSRALTYTILPILKSFLIPDESGNGYRRIRGVRNMIKVIKSLDEIDWQTLTELAKIMIEPYQFEYAVKDLVCPQCKSRSTIQIQDMTRLLFIVARSLSSVQVVLKKV